MIEILTLLFQISATLGFVAFSLVVGSKVLVVLVDGIVQVISSIIIEFSKLFR